MSFNAGSQEDRRPWDHTRSPRWNLTHAIGMSRRELVSGATAVVVLLSAFGVSASRDDADSSPVIVSFPDEASAGEPRTSGEATSGQPNSDVTTDDGAAPGAAIDGTVDEPAATTPSDAEPTGSEGSSASPTMPGATRPTSQATLNAGTPPAPSKDAVVVGFLRQTGTGENAGFATPNQGDPNGQINTLVDWMNTNGGLNGHAVTASIRTVDINNTGRQQEEATCRAFTEQDKAFAVVPLAMIYAESRACYAANKTMLFDATPFHMPEPIFQDLAPYLWATTFPSTGRMIRALAQSLESQGFFEPGAKVGFVSPDSPYFRASYQADAVPAFGTFGVEFAEAAFVQNDSIPNTQSGLQQAAFRFQTQGITHVVFYGNALLAPLFMTNAEANAYFPRYGLTSFDQPKFTSEQWATPASLEGAVGAGFSAAQDVADTEVAFPAPREQKCLDIYAADGHTWATRADAKIALGYCDAVFLMMDASGRLGDRALTAENISEAIYESGTSFQAPSSFGSRPVRGRFDVADTYRPMAYDADCDCFVYTAGPTRIPG